MDAIYADAQTIAQKKAGRKQRARKARQRRRLVLLAGLLLAAYLLLLVPVGLDIPFFRRTASEEYGWNLILVNGEFHIPPDYAVDLVTLSNGQQVDRRIYPALQEMFDTMRREGVYPIVASGYRTQERQQQLFREKISEYEQEGHSWYRARKLALQWVAKPGTSEHQLGIAVDINQDGTRSTARQVYDWLESHAHRYGFIYRYPGDKTEITGVSQEPWHYRYVGVEAATEMFENRITLEEYLALLK